MRATGGIEYSNNRVQEILSGTGMNEGKPKLLFLAHAFPPLNGAGSVRLWNIAKYLARLGWQVTVVSPDPCLIRNAEDPGRITTLLAEEGIRRLVTGYRWRCLSPEALKCWDQKLGWVVGGVCRTIARNLGIERSVGWIKAAEHACSSLSPKDVDVILASGSPFVAFRLAKRLSDRLDRPYVLDYRDLWTGNAHEMRRSRPATIREEVSLLQGCAAVTIVSPSWGVALDQRYGVGEKLHVVSNGYDSSEMATVKPYDFGHCAFVYAGVFYLPKRAISPFMAALKHLKESLSESSNEWYFHYYGKDGHHVREQAERFGVSDRVVFHGRVSRREAVSAVKGASLAVVITSVEEHGTLVDNGIVTGKIFEAIGVGTPVLLIAPKGSDATTTTETTGLVRSFVGTDIQGMASFLKDVVLGQVPNPKNVEVFSWTNIAKQLDAVLRKVIAANRVRSSNLFGQS
jgi:glycosyltransferase involved in cell wall biosynthesis